MEADGSSHRPRATQQVGVRIDGVETATGKMRPRQLGTYPSKRAGTTAAFAVCRGRRHRRRPPHGRPRRREMGCDTSACGDQYPRAVRVGSESHRERNWNDPGRPDLLARTSPRGSTTTRTRSSPTAPSRPHLKPSIAPAASLNDPPPGLEHSPNNFRQGPLSRGVTGFGPWLWAMGSSFT